MRCVKIILIALLNLSLVIASCSNCFAAENNIDWEQERVNYERKHQSKDYEDALAIEVLQEMISDRD